jgi:integrase
MRCRIAGGAFVLVAASSSLRFSELVALRVDRLDLPGNPIRVEEKITEAGHLIHGTSKTERSRRAVTVPDFVTFELAEHLRRYPPGPDGLVFTMARGGPIRRPAIYRLVWVRRWSAQGSRGSGSASCGTPERRWRWRPATNPVLVAGRLGHTSTRMVEQHYAGRLDRAARLPTALGARRDAARVRHASGTDHGVDGANRH